MGLFDLFKTKTTTIVSPETTDIEQIAQKLYEDQLGSTGRPNVMSLAAAEAVYQNLLTQERYSGDLIENMKVNSDVTAAKFAEYELAGGNPEIKAHYIENLQKYGHIGGNDAYEHNQSDNDKEIVLQGGVPYLKTALKGRE